MRRTTALIVLLAVLLAGCAPVAPAGRRDASEPDHPRAISAPVRHSESLAAVGDSITAWNPPFALNPAQSWVYTATDNDLPLVGGWAVPGSTLAQMQAAVTPAPSAYFLVIMGGTNDIYQGTPIADRLTSIDAIAATIGAHRVVLSSVAPYNPDPGAAVEWNTALEVHAAARGWDFIDPWMNVRTLEATYMPGADYGDGVHPSPASAAIIGASIRILIDRFYAEELTG